MSGQLPSFFVGTPFVTKRRHELNKSDVLNTEGRSRFHGAFEGGYSAGYYNTVGSVEGWRPSQYVRGQTPTVEDYMDEEDDAFMGSRVRASTAFATNSQGSTDAFLDALFSGDKGRSHTRSSGDMGSLGKRLFALCLNREARKHRFLEEEEQRSKKRTAPLMVVRRGLGFKNEGAANSTSESIHRLYLRDDEADDELMGSTSRSKDSISHHVVDVEQDESAVGSGVPDRASSIKPERFSKILQRLNGHRKEQRLLWLDGTELPSGCVMAKKYDPNQFMLERKSLSTSIPDNVQTFHRVGHAKPLGIMRSFTREDIRPTLEITKQSQRFVAASDSDGFQIGDEQKQRATEFVRKTANWAPNPTLRQMFQIERDNAKGILGVSEQSSEATRGANSPVEPPIERASINELKAVFEPRTSPHADEEFYSSEDSFSDSNVPGKSVVLESARDRTVSANSSDASSVSSSRKGKAS